MKSFCGMILATVLLLITATAFATKPVSFGPYEVYFHQDPWMDCSVFPGMDHTLGVETWVDDYGLMHFDKDGMITKINGFTHMTFGVIWNSSDTSKAVTTDDAAGGAEHKHYMVLFDEYGKDVMYKESGITFKATLPGHGPISVNAGTAKWKWDYDLMMWVPEVITPHSFRGEGDIYELCYYLW
jgi:hypothetical protein